MKNVALLFFIILFSALRSYSQGTKSEFEIIRSIFETEKKGYFEKHMALSPDEETIFWPIFEDYEIDKSKYARKRMEALRFFVENYQTMTSGQAKDYINDIFSFQKRDLKLKKKYYRLMSNNLSHQIAVRFIEIDEYVNTSIKLRILESLPYIKE